MLPGREMTLGEISSTGFRAYFTVLAKLLAGILLIYGAKNLVVALVPFEEMMPYETVQDAVRVGMYEARFDNLLDRLFGVVAVLAAVHATGQVLAGNMPSARMAFRSAVSRWLPMIGTEILAGFIVLGLLLLLIVPGIVWGVFYTFLVPCVAFGLSGPSALAESKRLVKGNWWRTLGCLLVLKLVSFLLALPGIIIPMVVLEPEFASEAADFLGNVYFDTVWLFDAVATTVFFLNRRSVVDAAFSRA